MTLGIQEVRKRYGVGEHTVLAWIRAGDLKALNVSKTSGGKPHWRITPEALAEFETSRTSGPPAPKAPRKKRQPAGTIQFYK